MMLGGEWMQGQGMRSPNCKLHVRLIVAVPSAYWNIASIPKASSLCVRAVTIYSYLLRETRNVYCCRPLLGRCL